MRESCSQSLGVVMKYLETESIRGVTNILLQLLKQQQWEVRHGGLLGIKYLLAVRRVGHICFSLHCKALSTFHSFDMSKNDVSRSKDQI